LFAILGVSCAYIAATHQYVDAGFIVNLLCEALAVAFFGLGLVVWTVAFFITLRKRHRP
jgi:hypothetical protein